MSRGSSADRLEPSQATLALPRCPSPPCSLLRAWLSGGGRCWRGTACFVLGCSAPCGVKWVSGGACVPAWLGVQARLRAQGTKGEAGALPPGTEVPAWDFYSQPETGGERGGIPFLPCAGSGVRRRLPLLPPRPKQLSAYLEENQVWKRLSLSMFQRLLATEGLTFSKVSMNAGSTDRQSSRSSGSCRKEILLLPAEEVVTGGPVWHAGRRSSEALVPGRLQHVFPLPSPWRVCCATHPCWRMGCVVPWLRRIALSSLWQSSAGQAMFRITSQVSPAGTAGFNSSKWRSGKCRCSCSPPSAQPAH